MHTSVFLFIFSILTRYWDTRCTTITPTSPILTYYTQTHRLAVDAVLRLKGSGNLDYIQVILYTESSDFFFSLPAAPSSSNLFLQFTTLFRWSLIIRSNAYIHSHTLISPPFLRSPRWSRSPEEALRTLSLKKGLSLTNPSASVNLEGLLSFFHLIISSPNPSIPVFYSFYSLKVFYLLLHVLLLFLHI